MTSTLAQIAMILTVAAPLQTTQTATQNAEAAFDSLKEQYNALAKQLGEGLSMQHRPPQQTVTKADITELQDKIAAQDNQIAHLKESQSSNR